LEFPNPLISLIRLLLLSESDWEKTRTKQKLPKAKLDDVDGAQILHIINSVAQKRLEEYPTTLEVQILWQMNRY
jgi:SET domain-containing protein 6